MTATEKDASDLRKMFEHWMSDEDAQPRAGGMGGGVMELRKCGACRGYKLERRWCSFCRGAGVVCPKPVDKQQFLDALKKIAQPTEQPK